MNHNTVAAALGGRYVKLAEDTGYLESNWVFPSDGRLIGAYIVATEGEQIRITDDGDIIFNAAVAGANITRSRTAHYRGLVEHFGLVLSEEGAINTICTVEELPLTVAKYMQAASAVAQASLKHRPKDVERFKTIVGSLLDAQYGDRVTRHPETIGISGHQLHFHFGIDLDGHSPTLIQTIAAEDDKTNWISVYEAGGKFGDVRPARANLRLIAILEAAKDTEMVGRYFADAADVVIYDGGPLTLAA